jgi:putative heme iron utilization protein
MTGRKKHVIRETDAEAIRLARTLIRTARYGALAVIDPSTGAPHASRVALATDVCGAPLILVSALTPHTGAIVADPRCSLLVGEPGRGDPLAHPRISLACRARHLERGTPEQARAERRYLNRQSKAKLYAGFGDFSFFRLDPDRASLNGGFGKAYLLEAADILTKTPALEAFAQIEQSAIDHMNADHREAITLYAQHYAKAAGGDWAITGFDPDGMDLADGEHVLRIFFDEPLEEPDQLRKVLVEMATKARTAAGSPPGIA